MAAPVPVTCAASFWASVLQFKYNFVMVALGAIIGNAQWHWRVGFLLCHALIIAGSPPLNRDDRRTDKDRAGDAEARIASNS
jgi:hypothetical protein